MASIKKAASREKRAMSDDIAYNGTLFVSPQALRVISRRRNLTYMTMILTTARCSAGLR